MSTNEIQVHGAKSQVVIVGAGFGSRLVVKQLANNPNFDLIVIQPNDFAEVSFGGMHLLIFQQYHLTL